MKATELRKETDKLESSIKELVDKFIENVGACDIRIDVDSTYIEQASGNKVLINSNLKVFVTV